MVVGDIDLRLLKVFRAVVKSGSYANAQTTLGVTQSTISTQMTQLEQRLGLTLCHRGRAGFRLTVEGESLYKLTSELFQSVSHFQNKAAEIKDNLSGTLRIGFLDNIISDKTNPLMEALRKFDKCPENKVQITLESLSPTEMERCLLDDSLDVAVGIFDEAIPGLQYSDLYEERDSLVCHSEHSFAKIDNPRVLARALPKSKRVVRSFIGQQEFPFDNDAGVNAFVTSLEASAMLILTGGYIGFLPVHYSQSWIDKGELVELMPEKITRYSRFSLVVKDSMQSQSRPLQLLLDCIAASCKTPRTQTNKIS